MIFYIKVGSETQFLITINFYSLNMVFIYVHSSVNERIPSRIIMRLGKPELQKPELRKPELQKPELRQM